MRLGFCFLTTHIDEFHTAIIEVRSGTSKRYGDGEEGDGPTPKKYIRQTIPTIGPLSPGCPGTMLMYPMRKRMIFQDVFSDIVSRSSTIIHGPYQSGKTTLIWALNHALNNSPSKDRRIEGVLIDMSTVKGSITQYGPVDGFYNHISQIVFNASLGRTGFMGRIRSSQLNYCLLFDEFQWIFETKELLSVAQEFLRFIAATDGMCYVAVGTYQLTHLMDRTENLVSPFNKARFRQMEFFSVKEMSQIFYLYKENVNLDGVDQNLQPSIMDESGGHAASFMILLKLYDECRPSLLTWPSILRKNIQGYLNGTHVSLKSRLKSFNVEIRDRVRQIVTHGLNAWPCGENGPDSAETVLLDAGIIIIATESRVYKVTQYRFTNAIFLKLCIDTLMFRSKTPELERDFVLLGPLEYLAQGLHLINSRAVNSPLVRGVNGPKEASFQAELYTSFNQMLPISTRCVFEAKASKDQKIDLLIAEDTGKILAGYELKTNKTSTAELDEAMEQGERYANFYNCVVYVINFHLEGRRDPMEPQFTWAKVVLVNVCFNADCTKFYIPIIDREVIVAS